MTRFDSADSAAGSLTESFTESPVDSVNDSSARSSAELSFTDLASHWSRDCVLALVDRGILHGYPDGTFRPDATVTRAEYATLLQMLFSQAPVVRPPIEFVDLPPAHWAYQAIGWSYERGFFAGYPGRQFQPDAPIPRGQAIGVLVTPLQLAAPPHPAELLGWYFDDAAAIPQWLQPAIAAAVLGEVVVNVPEVRQFQAGAFATRGEVAAILCRSLRIPDVVPPEYITTGIGIYELAAQTAGEVQVPFIQWFGSARLLRDIQVLLTEFRLYDQPPTGRYDWETEQALTAFCAFYGLNTMRVGVLDAEFAWALTHADSVEFVLAHAPDRSQLYAEFLAQEAGYGETKLAFLDRGAVNSPYFQQIAQFPDRLRQLATSRSVPSGDRPAAAYPEIERVPPIDETRLDFLDASVTHASVCVGGVVNDRFTARWLGRNALENVQLWSATKFLPLLYLVSKANAVNPKAALRDCLVCPNGTIDGSGFYDLAEAVMTYQGVASSNAIAAMFKQFATPDGLQAWLKGITGNYDLTFQGRYGEEPWLAQPLLYSQALNTILLAAPPTQHVGENSVSAYDLTRCLSLLGWHFQLPGGTKLPIAQWHSLETIVRAMGMDSARYLDVAIERLGLLSALQSPVICSKLGFGRSSARDRTELVYTAFLWGWDQRRQWAEPRLRSLAMTLRVAQAGGDADAEARAADARMATEVTEILRRLWGGEWD